MPTALVAPQDPHPNDRVRRLGQRVELAVDLGRRSLACLDRRKSHQRSRCALVDGSAVWRRTAPVTPPVSSEEPWRRGGPLAVAFSTRHSMTAKSRADQLPYTVVVRKNLERLQVNFAVLAVEQGLPKELTQRQLERFVRLAHE